MAASKQLYSIIPSSKLTNCQLCCVLCLLYSVLYVLVYCIIMYITVLLTLMQTVSQKRHLCFIYYVINRKIDTRQTGLCVFANFTRTRWWRLGISIRAGLWRLASSARVMLNVSHDWSLYCILCKQTKCVQYLQDLQKRRQRLSLLFGGTELFQFFATLVILHQDD